MILDHQFWRNGRLHRVWHEPMANGRIRVIHERLEPPEGLKLHAKVLEDLQSNKIERARKSDGLHLIGKFTFNERDRLHQMGVKFGDTDGLKWAMKQEEFKHAKVGS